MGGCWPLIGRLTAGVCDSLSVFPLRCLSGAVTLQPWVLSARQSGDNTTNPAGFRVPEPGPNRPRLPTRHVTQHTVTPHQSGPVPPRLGLWPSSPSVAPVVPSSQPRAGRPEPRQPAASLPERRSARPSAARGGSAEGGQTSARGPRSFLRLGEQERESPDRSDSR